jgi:hypothetical protein
MNCSPSLTSSLFIFCMLFQAPRFAVALSALSNPDSPDSRAPYQTFSPKFLDRALDKTDVKCADPRSCPEGVGILFNLEKGPQGQDQYDWCTISLISDRIVATNGHCIPAAVKADPNLCPQLMAVKFPSKSGKITTAHCKQVLSWIDLNDPFMSTHIDVLKPDFAFIELAEQVDRTPLTIDASGISDGQALTIYSVDPLPDPAIGGTIVSKTCVARQNTVIVPEFSYNLSEVASAQGCQIVPGNSGSAVLNNEGHLVALAHGRVPSMVDELKKHGIWWDRSSVTESETYVAYLTNFACLRLPLGVESIRPPDLSCTLEAKLQMESVGRRRWSEQRELEFQNQVDRKEAEWFARAPDQFEWSARWETDLSTPMEVRTLVPSIVCIKRPRAWSPLERAAVPVVNGQAILKGDYERPELDVIYTVDDKFRAVRHLAFYPPQIVHFMVALDFSNDSENEPRVSFQIDDATPTEGQRLKWCQR